MEYPFRIVAVDEKAVMFIALRLPQAPDRQLGRNLGYAAPETGLCRKWLELNG